jgi:UPF0755 protein
MLDDQFTPGPTPPSASTFSDVPSHAAGKRRKSSRNKPALVIGSIIGVLVLVGAVLGGLFYTGIIGGSQNDYSGGGHGEVIFTIAEGEIGDQIANNLVEAGVTKV